MANGKMYLWESVNVAQGFRTVGSTAKLEYQRMIAQDWAPIARPDRGFVYLGGFTLFAVAAAVVILATLDLELGDYIKRTIFNFEKHRRIEHYRLITERTGAKTEV